MKRTKRTAKRVAVAIMAAALTMSNVTVPAYAEGSDSTATEGTVSDEAQAAASTENENQS